MAVIETEGNNGGRRIIAPNEALARLNHAIVTYESNHVRTATAVCGIINTETHELLIARAGHPYPILLNGEGTATDITAEGAMLGVFDDARYDLQRVQLEPGDRLIIYSDGFEMAFPQIDPADATRLATVTDQYLTEFLDLGQGSVDAALGRLGDKLDQQAGSLNQMDDLTVVLVGIEPAGEPIECPTPLTQTA
jgi:sigma-B regulation protein RsbU (phosphoserine phosphatase)